MKMFRSTWLALVAAGLLAGTTRAQDRGAQKEPAKSIKLEDRKHVVEFDNVPWSKVITWFKDLSNLPYNSTIKAPPTGTFTFSAPAGQKFNIAEISDILNEALQREKYALVRKPFSFTIIPADDPPDPSLVDRILPEELDKWGNADLVSVVYPLKSQVAEEIAPEIKKMMTALGQVSYLSGPNQLIMLDRAKVLRTIIEVIKKNEAEGTQASQHFHKCIFVLARDAAQVLTHQLGDIQKLITLQQGGGGFPQSFRSEGGGGPDSFRKDSFREGGPSRSMPTSKIRPHYVTFDEQSNQVFISGPANKVDEAKRILAELDKEPYPGAPKVLLGQPFLQNYVVPPGTADSTQQMLMKVFQNSATLRITPVGNYITVYGMPEDHIRINALILRHKAPGSSAELIPLTSLEANATAITLNRMFNSLDPKAGAPYIEADIMRNALMIRGSADQVTEIKTIVKAMGENPEMQASNELSISVPKTSAAALANALQRLLPQMRGNPVKVILPGSIDEVRPEPQKKVIEPPDRQDGPQDTQFFDPQKQKKNLPVKEAAPITIMAYGNKLIVSSDDKEALKTVRDLIRLLTQSSADEGDFQVIQLRSANAVDVAKLLDEMFNGRQQGGGGRTQGGPGGGFQFGGFPGGGMFGGQQGERGGGTAKEPVIRVVADPTTNSLLIKAKPLDMLTIRNLLDNALDVEDEEGRSVQTRVIGPLKFASASEVATVIRDVYTESMARSTRGPTGGGPGGFFGGAGTQSTGARGTTLSVGVDDRTNSLIMQCSKVMYDDVKKLVDHMETAAKESNPSIEIFKIKGVDPTTIQTAIEAVQGRRTTTGSGSSTGNRGPFGSQGGTGFGGNTGGFGTGGSPFGGMFGNPGGGNTGGFGGFRGPGGGGFNPGGSGIMPQGPGGGRSGFTPGGGNGPGSGRTGFSPGGTSGRGGFSGSGGTSGARIRPQTSSLGPPGGRDFFVQRVTDDPDDAVLYDPQLDTHPRAYQPGTELLTSEAWHDHLLQVSAQEQEKKLPPGKDPLAEKGTVLPVPRLPVVVEALPELGALIIRAQNQADLDAAKQIIRFILENAKDSEVQIFVRYMKHADATSVVSTLSQLFSRVLFGPTSTTALPAGRAPVSNIPRVGGQGQTPDLTSGVAAPATASGQQAVSIVMIPLVRQNAILMAVPKSRVADIEQEIARLDVPSTPGGTATPIRLKQLQASRVASTINTFWATRYPNEAQSQHQIRVTWDDFSNTVFVQAAPADMAEIQSLIRSIDGSPSAVTKELRVIPLKNAVADELSVILIRALAEIPTALTGPTTTGQTGAGAGLGLGAAGLGAAGGAAAQPQPLTRTIKSTALRFFSSKNGDPNGILGGFLDDIHITADARTNSVVISAPKQTMELVLAIIRELDAVPLARSEVRIFGLKKTDANQLAATLQTLFLGRATGGAAGGIPGLGLAGGGAAAQTRPLQLTLQGQSLDGAPIVDLRLSVDDRTNSLVVAGSINDIDVIHAIVAKLEDAEPMQERIHVAYKLRNAVAADISATINNYWNKTKTVQTTAGEFTGFQGFQKEVVIEPESFTNTLLINATPRYMAEVLKLVETLDSLPPQVVIQCLVAEVDLNNAEEFGVEFGLQYPVLFRRGFAAGVGPGIPGFNFNSTQPLGNTTVDSQSLVGYQQLSTLGVGRVSPTQNVGGFVFSGASESVNVLVRALRTQGRIDILSRPQVTAMDSQNAKVNFGQDIPILDQVVVTGLTSQQSITRRTVGIKLDVTPKITPDGRVLMRIIPEVSSVSPLPIQLGNGVLGTVINLQQLETTVTVGDGETVVLGGLISKRDAKTENKIPILGDVPILGSLFRFRTQQITKTELIIILTPHVVRSKVDAERILAEEARRMDWIIGDVLKVHGTSGMAPAVPPGTAGVAMPTKAPEEMLPSPKPMPPAKENGAATTPGGVVTPARLPPPLPVVLPTIAPQPPDLSAVPFSNGQPADPQALPGRIVSSGKLN